MDANMIQVAPLHAHPTAELPIDVDLIPDSVGTIAPCFGAVADMFQVALPRALSVIELPIDVDLIPDVVS